MSTPIGSYEAKTRLPELLRLVREGKSFIITNRGQAIAELVPIRDADDTRATRAAEAMAAFMQREPVRGVDIRALIEEGRR